MNSWVVVLCAAVVCCAVVQCDKEAHKAQFQECAKEHHVSEDQLKEMKEKSKSPDFVPSENVKCMKKCVSVKMGLIKDGKLDTEHIKQWAKEMEVDSAKVQAAIDECAPLMKSDSCDDAYKAVRCLHSHHHHHHHHKH